MVCSLDLVIHPVDFIAKLAALVPKPRVNLTRFHGVFAPAGNGRHFNAYKVFAVN